MQRAVILNIMAIELNDWLETNQRPMHVYCASLGIALIMSAKTGTSTINS